MTTPTHGGIFPAHGGKTDWPHGGLVPVHGNTTDPLHGGAGKLSTPTFDMTIGSFSFDQTSGWSFDGV